MNIKSKQGFGLIEIMVALVIVAVAGAAGSKLLGVLFESSSDAQSRWLPVSWLLPFAGVCPR
ncbi:type II secretion system protein [Methyloprofundus sp.]|uniref:type II secretion system protein n=1 Tax=Methyloprofundus sp. TaxID=2020875 RepID=UPI003D0EF066